MLCESAARCTPGSGRLLRHLVEHRLVVLLEPVVVQLAEDADAGLVVLELEAGKIRAELVGGVVHHDVEQLAAGELDFILDLMHVHNFFTTFQLVTDV